jgi:predicted regulator of Ras-like GTPase activity (Roadblock/LC7/MglB family)
VPDEIRRLSEELARNPSSPVFLPLGEALRRAGQLDLALHVAERGVQRHGHNAEAHDLLARIRVDRGELEQALSAWERVLEIAPGHVGARKGMGYVLFKQGRLSEAELHLSTASDADGADGTISTALSMVRQMLARNGEGPNGNGAHAAAPVVEVSADPTDVDARLLFADILGQGEHTALLLDATGMVLAGVYLTADGSDVGQEVGAELSGVRDEAERATRHLGIGDWSAVLVETEAATVAMSPVADDAVLLIAASRAMPLGFVRRILDTCAERAVRWLGRHA